MQKDARQLDRANARQCNISKMTSKPKYPKDVTDADIAAAQIETHPWQPFLPGNSKVLIMGTFPPGPHRWSMNFYYPNRTNDFWKMCGLIFFNDPLALYDEEKKSFILPEIKSLLEHNGIALSDTGYKIRRLKGNASDKYLDIIQPVDLFNLLKKIPACHTIATTGEKAAGVIAELTGSEIPKLGEYIDTPTGLRHWRMPSTSRAYPLPLIEKAEYYTRLFHYVGILPQN